ncbi:uncharacterized protein AMSG_12076 [Thecamonas trahens ATCC 50062]|uniref:Rho-GAP domain-containing protein n=1 Tax=Thecamonas trahens ATCC 50062 TaxID=461836 RepID=A0A0L0DHM5_THETB|nr:hypothetical protein AMSG_12076 [Thecamonas trahens ATCC 50062]KNC51601.1 hypothetical protein AMSG_12076 [Thecamonas trahens ATCC 50062]|eukprot:XP_013756040.1 hypothetical protein AMSG_12076 [Thecamonas trahens ATCC 50062]
MSKKSSKKSGKSSKSSKKSSKKSKSTKSSKASSVAPGFGFGGYPGYGYGQQFGGFPQQQFGGFPQQQFGGEFSQFGGFPQQQQFGGEFSQFGGFPQQQQFGGEFSQFGGFPQQQQFGGEFSQFGGFPQQQQFGGFPQQFGGFPQQQFGGYPVADGSGYEAQQFGGYGQQFGGFPQQQFGGFPQQQFGGFPQQQFGGYGQYPGYGYGEPDVAQNDNIWQALVEQAYEWFVEMATAFGLGPSHPGTSDEVAGASGTSGDDRLPTISGLPLAVVVAINPSQAQPGVPELLAAALDFVEANALDEEGLFRINGYIRQRKQALAALDPQMLAGARVQFLVDPASATDSGTDAVVRDGETVLITLPCVHTVASLVKHIIRALPEPLINDDAVRILTSDNDGTGARWELLEAAIPFEAYALLKRLARHLAAVVAHEASNRMSASAISIVFAGTMDVPREAVIGLLQEAL